MEESQNRIQYLEILRVIATIAVVTLHAAGDLLNSFNSIGQSWWLIANGFNSGVRWCIPIFVMISGALLLSGKTDLPVAVFLKKRIRRVLIPLLSWGVIYTLWNHRELVAAFAPLPLKDIAVGYIQGPIFFHLWFVYMILGLYFIAPVLRVYIKGADKSNLKYFIILCFIATSVYGFISKFFGITVGVKIEFFTGYTGYFVLGYYLHNYELRVRDKRIIYLLAYAGLFITFLGTSYFTYKNNGAYFDYFHTYLSPNVFFTSLGIYIFMKDLNWSKFLSTKIRFNKSIAEFSSLSFGIYLVHVLIFHMLMMKKLPVQITAGFVHPLVGIPLTVLTTLVLSFLAAKIISKTPVIKKIFI
ncbi:MAG: acyltransferase family protein [bacterium]|nr:acyltransferase family protein [bacterium]